MTAAPAVAVKARILVVDDDVENVRLLTRTLRDRFEVAIAHDGEKALSVARETKPDIIITDQRMPRMSGTELLAKIREFSPQARRILITGYTDYNSLVDAVNRGHIDHYVEKPFRTAELITILDTLMENIALSKQRDDLVKMLAKANSQLRTREQWLEHEVQARTAELEETNKALRDMAVRDPLTGIANRRYLIDFLGTEIALAKRYNRPVSLLFIDVDHFKQINDKRGHAFGDKVLTLLGGLLREKGGALRDSDTPARFGGDEFCVVLPETDSEGAFIVAERLRTTITSPEFKSQFGDEDGISLTIGIASSPRHAATAEELLHAADTALYKAKRQGRNLVAIADDNGSSGEQQSA
jgi:two-component system cell cycle response regulator